MTERFSFSEWLSTRRRSTLRQSTWMGTTRGRLPRIAGLAERVPPRSGGPGIPDPASRVYAGVMTTRSVAPIDPRGPRTNQAVLAAGLVLGLALDWWYVAPIFAVVLFLGVAFGPRANPTMRFYADVLRPRLGPRPSSRTLGRPASPPPSAWPSWWPPPWRSPPEPTLGWALALIVAALAALAATTGICVGCEMYLAVAKRRGVELVA